MEQTWWPNFDILMRFPLHFEKTNETQLRLDSILLKKSRKFYVLMTVWNTIYTKVVVSKKKNKKRTTLFSAPTRYNRNNFYFSKYFNIQQLPLKLGVTKLNHELLLRPLLIFFPLPIVPDLFKDNFITPSTHTADEAAGLRTGDKTATP